MDNHGTANYISVAAAITLTEWSERTLWRRMADGSVQRGTEENGRAVVRVESLRPHLCVPLEPEDLTLIQDADTGDADAQNDLALLFLEHGKYKSALYWLDLATRQNHTDAMHWMGRCYIDGQGVEPDKHTGLMWLARSAARGHRISQAQIDALTSNLP